MLRAAVGRLIAFATATFLAAALALQVGVVLDLYAFELDPLWQMLGARGAVVVVLLNIGLGALLHGSLRVAFRSRRRAINSISLAGLVVAGLLSLWVVEWLLIEKPPTVRLRIKLSDVQPPVLDGAWAEDLSAFSLARRAKNPRSLAALEVAYARIIVNNPDAYLRHPPGATIDRHAAQFGLDPELLFTTLYLDSFYGEATSGPIPFLRSMTSETVRDVVQVHLPAWFVEGGVRKWLVDSGVLSDLFGETLGFKLTYAFHKATLDVSTQPFGVNIYTNLLLLMQEYPEQFRDVLGDGSSEPVRSALRESFLALDGSGLLRPYERPYGRPAYKAKYYDDHRKDLKRFARAAFYLMASDFSFATRAQALLLNYRREYYRATIGGEAWDRLPRWQQNAMLSMVQDVYIPNVGRMAYSVYAIPEINNTALAFVAAEAREHPAITGGEVESLWRPSGHEVLWGGAGYQLAVMNEIWTLVNSTPIPGIATAGTLDYAKDVVWIARGRLQVSDRDTS